MNKRFKELRKTLGLTQEVFAERIGISGPSVSLIENEERLVTERTIKTLMREFNVSYNWLVYGDGEMFEEGDAETLALLDDLIMGENKTAKALLRALARLTDVEWKLVEKMMADVDRWTKD